MAKEDKKDFNAMLADSRDMPKIQIVTDERTIQKYGGNRIIQKGRKNIRYYVADYEKAVFEIKD